LGITFIKAGAFLGEVAVDRKSQRDRIGIAERADSTVRTRVGNAGTRERRRVEAAATRIQVAPHAEVEGEHAEGRADTAIDIDFGRRTVRERDAFAGKTDVELQVLVDIVARFEIGRDRWLVIGLGAPTEEVIVNK